MHGGADGEEDQFADGEAEADEMGAAELKRTFPKIGVQVVADQR